ncbi:MAG: transposase [Nostoc sp.]
MLSRSATHHINYGHPKNKRHFLTPMPNYRRPHILGGTYFITQVTYQRQPWLCSDIGRTALRAALNHVRKNYPFSIDAFVLLPDHFHSLWTLPEGDRNISIRMLLIKRFVTKYYGHQLGLDIGISRSREKRKEGNLWQRRFWEHLIRDDVDFTNHCDYIHYNPVRHQLCESPQEWTFSSIHRFIQQKIYPLHWGGDGQVQLSSDIWDG